MQYPWELEGHHADEMRRHRPPPELQAIIDAEMGRFPLSAARASAPSLYYSPVTNNPYVTTFFGVAFLTLPFMFLLLPEAEGIFPWMLFLFGAIGLIGILAGAVRIPRWYRARARVREHIRKHGGKFPDSLRWNR